MKVRLGHDSYGFRLQALEQQLSTGKRTNIGRGRETKGEGSLSYVMIFVGLVLKPRSNS
jgi:hypothetical protein